MTAKELAEKMFTFEPTPTRREMILRATALIEARDREVRESCARILKARANVLRSRAGPGDDIVTRMEKDTADEISKLAAAIKKGETP